MNELKRDNVIVALQELDCLDLDRVDCLELCKFLLLRYPILIKDYPSLEDCVNALNQVILSEYSE